MIVPVSMQFQTVGILGLGRSGLRVRLRWWHRGGCSCP